MVFRRLGKLFILDDAAGKESRRLPACDGKVSAGFGRQESGGWTCDVRRPPAFISLPAGVRSHQLRTGDVAIPYAALHVAGCSEWGKRNIDPSWCSGAFRAFFAQDPGAL